MYDKLGLLNGQAWPRHNPWYAPNATMHGLTSSPYQAAPPPPPQNHSSLSGVKKGMVWCVDVLFVFSMW